MIMEAVDIKCLEGDNISQRITPVHWNVIKRSGRNAYKHIPESFVAQCLLHSNI